MGSKRRKVGEEKLSPEESMLAANLLKEMRELKEGIAEKQTEIEKLIAENACLRAKSSEEHDNTPCQSDDTNPIDSIAMGQVKSADEE